MLATHKVGRMIERNVALFLDKEQLPHATQQTELLNEKINYSSSFLVAMEECLGFWPEHIFSALFPN